MSFKIIGSIIIFWCLLDQFQLINSAVFYSIIVVISAITLSLRKKVVITNYFIPLIFLASIPTIILFGYSFYAIALFLIYLALNLVLSVNYSVKISDMKFMNTLLIITFIVAMTPVELRFFFTIKDILTSGITTWENNTHPWLFLLFFAYFYQNGEKKYALLNLFFLFISFKRIVILGVITFLIYNLVQYRGKVLKGLMLLPLFMMPFLPLLLISSEFEDYIYSRTGLYLTHITQGRSAFYDIILQNFPLSILPVGPGRVTEFSVLHLNYLVHNDHLKLILELGWPLYLFAIFSLKKTLPLPYFALLMVLMATDNVMIYFYFLFFFFILARDSSERLSSNLCYS